MRAGFFACMGQGAVMRTCGAAPESLLTQPISAPIYLVLDPVDMRCGMERLSTWVQNTLGARPCEGSAYVFRNRRAQLLKVLMWDATGVWLAQRRLHQGRFVWPTTSEARVVLTLAQWRWLVTGVDWQRLSATQPGHWRV
jgi:transposase